LKASNPEGRGRREIPFASEGRGERGGAHKEKVEGKKPGDLATEDG